MANRTNHTAGPASIPGQSPEPDVQVRRGVKALVAASGRALLVRERHADGTPFWTLPGGGAHPGEPHADALEREIAEELGCQCVVGETVDSFWYIHRSRPRTASLYVILACGILTEPTAVTAEGIEDVRWVRPTELPSKTLPQVRSVVRRTPPVDMWESEPVDTQDCELEE